jgi:uncharacterized protein (TIGR02145 family)
MQIKPILLTFSFVIIAISSVSQTTGTFTDTRDGQTYKTITIEDPLKGTNVTWMAQNLNYKTPDSWAYNNDESYRKGLGLLYSWNAAMKACPTGWHLPSDAEWTSLINEFGGSSKAGESLKSTKGWDLNGNGTNSSGFNALPGGHYNNDGSFNGIQMIGFWWSSSSGDTDHAWWWGIYFNRNKVISYIDEINKKDGLSIRCVKDN